MKSFLVGGVFLLLFVLLKVVCCEGCLKQEREALIALNSHLGNAISWSANTNTNCCEWERVECNTTIGRVTKLDLSIAEISNCTRTHQGLNNLEVLDLSGNPFDNAIGILSCLDGLSSLKSLSLANLPHTDSFHDFQTVLETISPKLLHLEVLDIGYNSLSNEILPSLRGFRSLKELYLSDIGLDSDLHFQGLCATLKNLEILDITFNNFNDTDIASALSGLSSLKSLNLGWSQLTMRSIHNISENHGFAWPASLQDLVLRANSLSNNIIPSLNGLPHLKSLDLSINNLKGSLDISGLSTLTSLKILDFSSNQLVDLIVREGLSNLTSLKILDFSNNQLVDLIVREENHGFAWPANLQHLVLSHNSLSNNIISSLKGLPRLKSLDLSANNLNGSLDISGLSTLTSLKNLDFSSNQLVDLIVREGSKNLSRLDILALDWNMINGSNLQESLQAFPSIKSLSLTGNEFKGTILAGGFHGLSNLEYLALDYSSNLENEFFKSIGDLPSLKVLSVLECGINGTLPIGDWSKLKNLEELDLSYNDFVGKLPSSFFNMTSLLTLKLADNHFIGNIGPNLASFTSLEYLDFEGNQFEFPISFTQFSNHSNLMFIYGNENKVILDSHSTMKTWVPKFQLQVLQLSSVTQARSIPIPSFLLYQYNLTYVDFTGCKLSGEFSDWLLENNTKMEVVILQNCSFMGDFHLPSRPRLNMATIDVSNNAISGQMFSNNISSIFPNLIHLNMSRNAIHGSIPYELGHLSFLDALDMSDNQLSGEIPHNLTRDGNQLTFLRFSNNNLHGLIPPMLSMFPLQSLLLDGNSLSGNIPSNFFNSCVIHHVDLSNNNLTGKIPSQMSNCTNLIELSMSNNHFEGSIPSKLAGLRNISYLDLSQNNLTGCVPSFVSNFTSSIHLSNNKLSCLSKNMFRETSSLVTLDLSNNEITNGFHDLIHDIHYTGLKILLLKGNHFKGNLPKQLCHLIDLNILDLSYNSFVGEIPRCLGKMPFENKDPEISREQFNGMNQGKQNDSDRFEKEKATFTSKKRSETYTTNVLIYMSAIDLSHNKLNGSIPSELGNLTRIRALNLSNNYFTGKIPATFYDLVQVESLDLSFNMLSGQIPPQLSGLNSLEVFSVAHNNLSGATPEWKGQFSTFDESSYEGNQFLCGPPLPKSCNPSGEAPTALPNGLNNDGDDDSLVDMYVFRVSFVVAYTSMLLVIATVLYINPYWRQAWFYYIGLVCKNCYYFIEDNLCKFF